MIYPNLYREEVIMCDENKRQAIILPLEDKTILSKLVSLIKIATEEEDLVNNLLIEEFLTKVVRYVAINRYSDIVDENNDWYRALLSETLKEFNLSNVIYKDRVKYITLLDNLKELVNKLVFILLENDSFLGNKYEVVELKVSYVKDMLVCGEKKDYLTITYYLPKNGELTDAYKLAKPYIRKIVLSVLISFTPLKIAKLIKILTSLSKLISTIEDIAIKSKEDVAKPEGRAIIKKVAIALLESKVKEYVLK